MKGNRINTFVFDEAHDFASGKAVWSEFKSLYDELTGYSTDPGVRIIFISNEGPSTIQDSAMRQRLYPHFKIEALTNNEMISFVRMAAKKLDVKIPDDENQIHQTILYNAEPTPRSILLHIHAWLNGITSSDSYSEEDLVVSAVKYLATDLEKAKSTEFLIGWHKICKRLYSTFGSYDENIINKLSQEIHNVLTWKLDNYTAMNIKFIKKLTHILAILESLNPAIKGSIYTIPLKLKNLINQIIEELQKENKK